MKYINVVLGVIILLVGLIFIYLNYFLPSESLSYRYDESDESDDESDENKIVSPSSVIYKDFPNINENFKRSKELKITDNEIQTNDVVLSDEQSKIIKQFELEQRFNILREKINSLDYTDIEKSGFEIEQNAILTELEKL